MLLIVKFDLHNLYDGVCNLYRYELPCAISLAGAISYTAKLQHETPNIRFMGRPYNKESYLLLIGASQLIRNPLGRQEFSFFDISLQDRNIDKRK